MAKKSVTRKQKPVQLNDQKARKGTGGGELHQLARNDIAALTTQQGTPVADDQNSLRIGARGPTALEDSHFREKIFHFDHERIPERVVHARGFGAHGYFENYESLDELTRADLFQRPQEKTPAFVRFSTVAGNKGSPDLARDVRGFAVKLYTKEGNWDIVGNNIPVFFIQDAIKFPDLIHAAKQEPDRGFPQAQTAHDNFWDFISLMPESIHMAMWIMSDRAIPRKVGRFVLDRCVDNFFGETEQVAFCTNNIVPGVDFSNDPLLQGRNFSYLDTQLSRLGGPNFTNIPINAPKCPFTTLQQDGHMALVIPRSRANYEPNSWPGAEGGPRETPDLGFHSYPAEDQGPKARVRSDTFADHYGQARQFYISQTPIEQAHIAASFTFELSKVERPDIRSRMVSHLMNVDSGLAEKVANDLGLKGMPNKAQAAKPTRTDLKPSKALSILLNADETFEGRKVGMLLTDGVDGDLVIALRRRSPRRAQLSR